MMNRLNLLAAVTMLAAARYANAQCGVERWAVKTGTDADVGTVNLNSTTNTTIAALRALTAPATLPAANRVQPTESTIFVLNATLTQYKLEGDSDYHLVLADASGNTMIAEIPAPGCVGAGSPFAAGISSSRSKFDARFTATTSFQTANVPVQIKGVGFFDFLHGQTGVAPNGIELHTILDLVFNPTSTPDFTLSSSGPLSIATGATGSTTIFASPSNGFNSTLTISAAGAPAGVTASFLSNTITGGSGSTNLNVTVGASVAAGSYTITVSATGGGVTHTLAVPLTVTSSTGSGNELMVDGGFESATASGNTAPGWTGTTTVSGHQTIIQNGTYPHAGKNYGNMGGVNSVTDTLTQTVSIAAGATANLTFWVNVVTQETTTATAYDTLAVEIHNSGGTLLSTPLTLSNLDKTSSNNTNGTYFQPPAINLSAYAGQTVKIVFRGICDSTLPTTFRLDDVSLLTSGGSGGGDTTPPVATVTAPANGATISGTTTVTAAATDNVGVTKLELYVDGALTTSGTTGSLSYSWNTAAVANGPHTLVAKGYDAAGNIGTSVTVTVTVSNSNAQQLLGNPGFENGSTNPSPWTASSGVIDNGTSEAAHSGSWKAWLDGYGTTTTDTISQQVAIPSTITTATLSFWLHIDTAETTTTIPYDTLKVQVQNTAGTVLATLATYSNLNHNTGYAQVSFNLAAYKGQTIKIVLIGAEDSQLRTSFVVDDFALNVQ